MDAYWMPKKDPAIPVLVDFHVYDDDSAAKYRGTVTRKNMHGVFRGIASSLLDIEEIDALDLPAKWNHKIVLKESK